MVKIIWILKRTMSTKPKRPKMTWVPKNFTSFPCVGVSCSSGGEHTLIS